MKMKPMKMHVLDNGRMWIDTVDLLGVYRRGNAENQHPAAIWEQIPIHTFLIDHPDGLVLFDTACDPNGMTENWSESQKKNAPYEAPAGSSLLERLEQLKVRPDDVKYVVVSHLHVDHAGGLKMFKKAKIFVSDLELTRAVRQYVLGENLGACVPSDIEAFIKAGLHWEPVDPNEKEIELLEGLTILSLGPGHSWGMLGLLVELPKTGNFLLASDALYTSKNAGPPVQLPGNIYDSIGYAATAQYITKYAARKHAKILYGHDMEQFKTLIKSTDGYYE
jgi:Zn-dependent hydrolases, including glyoxylases